MKHRTVLTLAVLTSLSAVAQADVVTPTETLVIHFTVNNSFTPTTPDVMRLNFGLTNVISPLTSRIASIYDGATLLGTATETNFGGYAGPLNLDPTNSFKSAGSPWTFGSPATIDFTSILNGTINGRIEYTVQTGAHDIDLNNINLTFIRASSGSGGTVVSPAPTITSVAVVGGEPGAAYCFGDGTAVACPCGNLGAAGEGCANTTGQGGILAASGSAIVGGDTVVLSASQCPATVPGLFFSGPNPSAGIVFGDGLRCVTGPVLRLGVVFTDGNGDAQTSGQLSVLEGLGGGELRHYQYWYRDVGGPCGGGFNTTNGYAIQW